MGELVERVDEWDRVLGVVERGEAIERGWLHRVATVVCRDARGRVLVHRRARGMSRFPGQYNWLLGGAAAVGESYEEAAGRELAEELGVRVPVRFVFKFLCHGVISPYWLGVHEAVIDAAADVVGEAAIVPDPEEIDWYGWLTEGEFEDALRRWEFVPDGVEAYRRYRALKR
ncbi:NUDIX domain-containing protein [Streptomyces sp. RG80]|uniref:NUDIX hydrolase n=1 Tax=Streptomyces sp. RG80 TaxID=3157340 RepID=UPI00338F5D06